MWLRGPSDNGIISSVAAECATQPEASGHGSGSLLDDTWAHDGIRLLSTGMVAPLSPLQATGGRSEKGPVLLVLRHIAPGLTRRSEQVVAILRSAVTSTRALFQHLTRAVFSPHTAMLCMGFPTFRFLGAEVLGLGGACAPAGRTPRYHPRSWHVRAARWQWRARQPSAGRSGWDGCAMVGPAPPRGG